MVDCRAWDEGCLGVDDRRLSRPQRESVGAGDTLGIEQRIDDERIGRRCRLLDPHRPERGELFAAWISGADRQPPRGCTESLAAGNGAKEARALKDRRVGKTAALARLQNPEPGKPEI